MLTEFACGCSLPASALHKCLLVCLWDSPSGAVGPAHTSSWGPAVRISSQLNNQWLQWNIYTMETGKCYKPCHPLFPICFGMWKNRVLVTIHFMSPSFCFFICNEVVETPRDNVYNMLSVFHAAAKSLQLCPTLRPHRQQPTRPPHPWDSPGKDTGVGCHFLLQCVHAR